MAKPPSLDREIRDLYRLPLADFTAARNALAGRLKKAGDGAAAADVRARAKLSPSAWVVTQLLAREPDRIAALIEAGKEARAAQRQALAGRGTETFRGALSRARRLVEELRRRAEAILAESGRRAGGAVAERLAADLQALAFTPAAAATVRRGFLDADLEPPGFEVLAGLQLAAAPQPADAGRTGRPERPEPRRADGTAGARHVAATKAAKAGRHRADAADAALPKAVADGRKRWEEAVRARHQREVARAKERVENAESEVARTEAEAAFRHAAAKQAERAAAEATKQARTAREAADGASERAERARAALARAREALAALRHEHRRGEPSRRSS
ncbi:MAG TPA: hypothetical protein VIH93_07690 [Thermoanaerobaculia bacterium]